MTKPTPPSSSVRGTPVHDSPSYESSTPHTTAAGPTPHDSPGVRIGAIFRRVGRHGLVPLVSGSVILVMVSAAIAAPLLAPHDPTAGELQNRLTPPAWNAEGSREFLLGTDALGRDILSRLLYGARTSMAVGAASVILAGVVGVVLGLFAGFFRGAVERAFSIISDIQISFPFLILAVAIVAVFGSGVWNVIIVLALSGWVLYGRVVRAEVVRVREMEFVQAGRALGAGNMRLVFLTIFPNVRASVIVIATFTFAQMVIIAASLSFLGVGIQPPTPTWGGMISNGREYLAVAWWLSVLPGLALLVLILAVNSLGDWLRDTLDPRIRAD